MFVEQNCVHAEVKRNGELIECVALDVNLDEMPVLARTRSMAVWMPPAIART